MQLAKLTDKLKPLTLAAGLLTTSGLVYADIDNYSKISATSGRTSEYINIVDKNDIAYLSTKFKFELHLKFWEEKTMFMSSAASIVDDIDFRSIVAMGKSVVPLIVEELERKPSTLVWALNFIFEQKISSKSNLTITEACKLWIKALS